MTGLVPYLWHCHCASWDTAPVTHRQKVHLGRPPPALGVHLAAFPKVGRGSLFQELSVPHLVKWFSPEAGPLRRL